MEMVVGFGNAQIQFRVIITSPMCQASSSRIRAHCPMELGIGFWI